MNHFAIVWLLSAMRIVKTLKKNTYCNIKYYITLYITKREVNKQNNSHKIIKIILNLKTRNFTRQAKQNKMQS